LKKLTTNFYSRQHSSNAVAFRMFSHYAWHHVGEEETLRPEEAMARRYYPTVRKKSGRNSPPGGRQRWTSTLHSRLYRAQQTPKIEQVLISNSWALLLPRVKTKQHGTGS